MLIPIERLLLRARHVRTRADELIALHGRLRAARAERPGDEERAAAEELRALKIRVSASLASVSSCASCAEGKRWPRGAFAGGDCCTGVTADLFSDEEVAALAAAGTRPRDLTAPKDEHAGCAFRGAQGCTLDADDRPERCVSYMCTILRRELRTRGELVEADAMIADLRAVMARFTALRSARLDDEILVPLEAAMRVTATTGTSRGPRVVRR
jgi:hypothetical protein